MPQMLLKAYQGQLKRLRAEEAFQQAEIIALGTGRLDKADRDRVVRRWRRALGREEGGVRLQGKQSDLKLLASLGMKVHQDGPR